MPMDDVTFAGKRGLQSPAALPQAGPARALVHRGFVDFKVDRNRFRYKPSRSMGWVSHRFKVDLPLSYESWYIEPAFD